MDFPMWYAFVSFVGNCCNRDTRKKGKINVLHDKTHLLRISFLLSLSFFGVCMCGCIYRMNANMNTNGLNLYSTSRHYTILHVLVVLISFLCATHILWIRIILTWNERKLHMNILDAIIQIPNAHLCFRTFWFHRFSFVVCLFLNAFGNRKRNYKSKVTENGRKIWNGREHHYLPSDAMPQLLRCRHTMSLAPSLSFIRSKWCNRTQ